MPMRPTTVVLFALLASPIVADIPVHCDAPDVQGVWDLSLTLPAKERNQCHHESPDSPKRQPYDGAMKSETKLQRRVHLLVAPGFKSQGGTVLANSNSSNGTWKMIADEGFELNFDSPHALNVSSATSAPLSLFAFSKYELPAGGDLKKSISHCGETLLGWYSIGRAEWGCWRAKRRIAFPGQEGAIKSVVTKPLDRSKPLSLRQASERVRRINVRQGQWKARVYDRWIGKTSAELALHRGVRWHKYEVRRHKSFLAVQGLAVNQTKDDALDMKQYFDGLDKAHASLPSFIDWRVARGGKNYLEPVADQGVCGSCWAVSGMRMMTARHKIAQNDTDALPWSISFPLYCSEFNQGCDGGFGYLAGKWSSEVGLLPATCATYTARSRSCSVNASCVEALRTSKAARWRATSPRYVGGMQRRATEALLMEELNTRGPAVVSLTGAQIGDDFMFYAGGIYSGEEVPPKDKSGGHAVLLAGYGTDNGDDYWLRGDDWGEDGYVRMSRKVIQLRNSEVADVIRDEQDGRQVDAVVARAKRL